MLYINSQGSSTSRLVDDANIDQQHIWPLDVEKVHWTFTDFIRNPFPENVTNNVTVFRQHVTHTFHTPQVLEMLDKGRTY